MFPISASAKNEEKRGSAVSKKRASVSSASSSKKALEGQEREAVKTAEKNGRVPTGKSRPPTGSEATEENKEQEDIRKSQATPVILEQVLIFLQLLIFSH